MKIYFNIPEDLEKEIEKNPHGLDAFRGIRFWEESGIYAYDTNAIDPNGWPPKIASLCYRVTDKFYLKGIPLGALEYGYYHYGMAVGEVKEGVDHETKKHMHTLTIDSGSITDLKALELLVKCKLIKPSIHYAALSAPKQTRLAMVRDIFKTRFSLATKLSLAWRVI
ncbi:MAG: hypothetical protein V4478_01195 [Patescibacteria group bacterium]